MSEAEPSSEHDEPEQKGKPALPSPLQQRSGNENLDDMRTFVQEMSEEMHMAMRSGPLPNPVLQKITKEQIDTLLAAEERENEREQERFKLLSEERKQRRELQNQRKQLLITNRAKSEEESRKQLGILIALFLVIIVVICFLFLHYQQAQYIITVITALLSFAGGFGAGRVSAPKEKAASEEIATPPSTQQ